MLEVVVIAVIAVVLLLVMGSSNSSKPRPSGRPLYHKSRSTRSTKPRTYRSSKPLTNQVRGKSAPPAIPQSRELSGKCYVIDGDTIVIRRVKVRLAGIDAPELDQPFGQKSKWAMVNICKGQVVTVKLNGETSYDRLVGTCYLSDGRDIGAELIKQGLAVDWGVFSGGRYRCYEPAGIRRKLGRPPFNR